MSAGNEIQFKSEVIARYNAYRKSKGAKPLKSSASLNRAADWYAGEMASRRAAFGHGNWAKRIGRFIGRRRATHAALAENIAYGQDNPAEVVAAWIASPGHERNMRDKTLRKIGVGFATRGDTEYWVVDLGTF